MKSVRNLFVLTVVLTLALSMAATSALFAQTFDVEDAPAVTVGSTSANVTLLRGTLEGDGVTYLVDNDTLVALRLKSCIEAEFAVSSLTVVKKTGATETPVTTVPITSSFEEDSLLYITGLAIPVADGDSLIFKVTINTAQAVANAATYDGTGLELSILPDGVDLRDENGLYSLANTHSDGTAGSAGYGHNPGFDALNCTGPYTGTFDLTIDFNFSATHLDTYDCGPEVFNIGDFLYIRVYNPGEDVDTTGVTVDLSAFGLSATHNVPYRSSTFDWRDTVEITAGALDFVPPFGVIATMTDIYGNSDEDTVVFNSTGIDNVNPVVDSAKFAIWQNVVGPADNAAIGDWLVLWVYTSSSGFFEVAEVVADVSRFVAGATSENLAEVTTGAGVWRLTFELTDNLGKDLPEGADTAKVAAIWVTDNACNTVVDTIDFLPALDIESPGFADNNYITLADNDNTGCTNLGDEVRVEIDVTGTDDIVNVWANFFEGGLGGTATQALTDEGSNVWALDWTIGTADDPGDDPPSLQAKDVNSDPTDAIYRVWIYFEDDAGNIDSTQTDLLLNTAGTAYVPLDSRRPTPIVQDDVEVIRMPGGELALRWPRSAPSQAGDANQFYVYVDSVGADINYDNVFGTTFNNEFGDPTYNYWYSGPLTHGTTYRFSIRTRDDCGNYEFNQSIYEGIPDAQAPTACVVFPNTGGNYGPNNTLTITAVSPDADILNGAAYAVYRLKDQGDGNPGPWYNYPISTPMTQDGQTFQQTINLGTDPNTAGTYELLIIGVDEVGNELSLADAEAACGYFEFTWNPIALVCDVATINGAFAPQTPCGFNVTRDDLNEAVVTIVNPDAGNFYTVDVWVQYDNIKTRIEYAESASLPYTFNFSALDWPKTVGGPLSNTMWVEITDERSGNYCETSVNLCVPDLIAPAAMITYPDAYQCIPIVRPAGEEVGITVEINPNAYDGDDAVRAEVFYTLDGTVPGTKIGEEVFGGEDYTTIYWDNSAMSEGYVWLYAIVWDQVNNSYQTPLVRVCLDGTAPEMTLSIKDQDIYGCAGQDVKWRVGSNLESVDLVAELTNLDGIDITDVIFFYQRAGDPEVVDIRDFWNWIGRGNPANNNSIWTRTWDISGLDCGYDYRIRVAVRDAAGNTMLDMDGDGYFDDYTFDDAMAMGAGMIMFKDCGAPEPAVSLFETTGEETRTWTNPSGELNGSGDVYAKMGETIRVQTITIPEDDTCEVEKVEYYLCGTFVGTGTDAANWWEITFDPFAMGVLDAEDVANDYYDCELEARMYDKLGQYSSDYIDVYFLDTTPANVLITDPGAGSYVCGEVDLNLGIFNGHDLKKVTWYYWPAAGGPKVKIAEVSPFVDDESLSSPQWGATWNIALNNPPNGDYYIGAEVCDIADNLTDPEDGAILVHVNCNQPSIVLTEPANGGFFCGGEYFCATVNQNNGAPIDYVQFQYKPFWSDEWYNFYQNPDREAPWCMELQTYEGFGSEGFYQFRAYVENEAGQDSYSEPITLFYDQTAPDARAVTVSDGVNTFDIEQHNDPYPSFKKGTQKLTFTFRARDNASEWGPSPIYNSGVAMICADQVCTPITTDDEGYFTVDWDISGLSAGEYQYDFSVYDAVGCNYSTVTVYFVIYEGDPSLALVAGCWRGQVFGVTEYGSSVVFQYRQGGGAWVAMGIAQQRTYEYLLNPDGSYTPRQWAIYTTDWAPADGNYDLRMLADNGNGYDESLSPILSVSVANGMCTATSNPANFGPGSIERNLENGCDNLEGLATLGSTYGMPWAIAVSYNIPGEFFEYDLVGFHALNQQGGVNRYSGSFYFDALVDDGFGEGHVYFMDYTGTTGWSTMQDYATFWVTRDFGTGGPVTFEDVTVDIPAEWTDYTETYANSIAIWKSKIARPSVWEDWLLTPVGDNNGMMTYISDPSCLDYGCGDDQQYAIITMQYDNTETTPAESLTVGWWDGEGSWHPENIYFPSTVRGFYTEGGQNWVQFAVTCFGDGDYDDAWYSVVKRTKYDGQGLVTRMQMVPYCDPYTSGYPDVWYQFVEPWQYQINWNTLEVYLDGVRIFARGYQGDMTQPKTGEAPTTALDEGSPQWSFFVDEVSAQLHISRNYYGDYDGPDSGDFDSESDYPPIPCGNHQFYIRVEDEQARPQYIRDNFTVDCAAPDVDFPNGFVTANPTITFTIDDEGSGVDWNEVFVDVYFVTKMDTTDGGNDGASPKERMAYIQTFFPAQIQDYLQEDGRTVIIPTTYDLDDERGLYVVVFDGTYKNDFTYDEDYYYYCYYGNCGDPSAWSNFDYYYGASDGVEDCVGNNTNPHVQFFVVDREGATITLQGDADACPLVFQIADDGSGIDEVEIYEGGDLLGNPVGSASEVDAAGEWYLATTGNGATLYYCPGGASYEIRVTDNTGRESSYFGSRVGTFVDGDIHDGWAGPSPFDPAKESFAFHVTLEKAAENVTIRIFNMGGELLKSMNAGSLGAGAHAISWDGKTDGGTMVAQGGYFAEVTAQSRASSARTIIRFGVVEK